MSDIVQYSYKAGTTATKKEMVKMRIREIEVKGIKFIFVNEYADTRNGFKHTSTLFRNRI